MKPRIWVGVHRNLPHTWNPRDGLPWSGLIHAITLARWGNRGSAPPGGWTFRTGPATHAFVVWQNKDGALWRVDADMPQASATRCDDPITGFFVPALADLSTFCPTALWELREEGGLNLEAALAQIELEKTRRYDERQMLAQAAGMLAPIFLTSFVPYRGDAEQDICTGSTCRVMAAAGGGAGKLAADVMEGDHFPEELGRKLSLAEGAPWLGKAHFFADT